MRLKLLTVVSASAACLLTLSSPRQGHAIRVFENEDSGTNLNINGYIQPFIRWVADDCIPSAEDPTTCTTSITNDGFGLDRARLSVSGNAHGIADFNLELNGTPTVDLLEANVTFEPVDALRLQIGVFKVPFQRSELVSESRRQFITRAENIAVAPGRQLGMNAEYALPGSLSGLPDGFVVVSAGVFSGERFSDRNTPVVDQHFLTSARLEFNPFGRPARLFEGDVRPLAERGEPILSVAANFAHNRFEPDDWKQDNLGADLFFAWQGLSLYVDYIVNSRNFLGESGADQTAAGFNAQIGYFLPAPYVQEHLELVARVEQFDRKTARDDADADALLPASPRGGPAGGSSAEQEQLGIHGGVNWYLSGHDLKIQAQYVHRIAQEDWALSAADSSIPNEFDDDTFYLQLNYRF